MSYFSGIGLRELMDRAGRTVDGERKRARWWQVVALVAIIGALGGPSVVQAVAGTDFAGINIIKDGLEVKVGDLLVDTGRLVVGAPTGPTPVVGGINAQAIAVNGTPVNVGAATPLPTCPAAQFLIGPGEPGSTCATAVPTATAVPAVSTPTPQINAAITQNTPPAGTILYFPGAQRTPGVYVTPQAAGSSNSTLLNFGGFGTGVASNNTIYFGFGQAPAQGTEANNAFPMTQAVTLTKIACTSTVAAGAGQSYTCTVRKTAGATAITCVISGASATTCTDTAHSATYAAADTVDVQVVSSATAASANIIGQVGT